ncbi:MAG TPA: DUF3035 domain-containing protein [Stellaceae bacterium]|nr:DUF3035 domain-containing protein [Stellaceae bacterium]
MGAVALSFRVSLIICALLAVTAVSGCDSFNRAIGREKVIPDEFAVVSRAPLAVPPDYSLRPPRIGEQRPQEQPTAEQARQTVFRVGDDQKANLPPAADQRSAGESELLKQAGAADAPKDIRRLVETDASGQVSDSFVDKLAFWRKDQKLGPTDAVIDPVAEQDRLDANRGAASTAAPAPELTGKPVIERTKSSSGGGFFSWLF